MKGAADMQVRRTYRYKLYQSKKLKHLDRSIGIAAEIWNYCIALHKRYYKLYHKHLSVNKLKVHLTKLKKLDKFEHWQQLDSQAIQDVAERIERSYQAFFDHRKKKKKGKKSPPKFKKRRNYPSFTLKQSGYKFLENNQIRIMGRTYKYVKHRSFTGTVKTVTIKRTKAGDYYICISLIEEWPDIKPRTGKAVGLDFGLKNFIAADDGTVIESPLWHLKSGKVLRKANRNLSRCQKGSRNRRRANIVYARAHKRVSNRRKDWFYKLANELVAQYDVICIEDLNIEAMKRLWGRKVSDLAFAEFVQILEWVAFKNGAQVVKIDRWYPSSKTCHVCGYIKQDLTLNDRDWTCPNCGTYHDRDQNAAINIKIVGTAMLN